MEFFAPQTGFLAGWDACGCDNVRVCMYGLLNHQRLGYRSSGKLFETHDYDLSRRHDSRGASQHGTSAVHVTFSVGFQQKVVMLLEKGLIIHAPALLPPCAASELAIAHNMDAGICHSSNWSFNRLCLCQSSMCKHVLAVCGVFDASTNMWIMHADMISDTMLVLQPLPCLPYMVNIYSDATRHTIYIWLFDWIKEFFVCNHNYGPHEDMLLQIHCNVANNRECAEQVYMSTSGVMWCKVRQC